MAYQENLFKFNLIPPISEKEVLQLEERDNSILYSFILIFTSMLVFVILSVLLFVVVQGRKSTLQSNIDKLEATIEAEGEPLEKHGAMVIKSSLLSPVLEQDIKMSQLLSFARQIAPNFEITKYGRELTGEFTLEIRVATFEEAFQIVRRAKDIESFSDVTIDRIADQQFNDSQTRSITMNLRFMLNIDPTINGS